MPEQEFERDDQAGAEAFDETHIDDEGEGDLLLDEADGVLDVTQADGDADEEAFDEDDPDIDETLGAAGVEAEADALLGLDGERVNHLDDRTAAVQGADEIELVYAGLMENTRGAQASAAHWEARTLSDDDIADLGYGMDNDGLTKGRARPEGVEEMTDKNTRRDQDSDTPHARRAAALKGKPDQLRERDEAEDRQESLVDEGVEETFPASDPVSVKRIT